MKIRMMVVGALGALLSTALVQADDSSGQHFIKDSIEGNLAEVKVGGLAEQKVQARG
jgi:predicted outer membrane protein